MREIRCRLSKIIIDEGKDGQVVWLQEIGGDRAFAIVVGFFEASSLRDRVRDFRPPRPMTHHLVSNCIRGMGGKLERIVVSELKDNTYFARLVVKQDGRTVEIDSRPSDALVLAAQERVPVYVAEDVLNEASKWSALPKFELSDEDLEPSEEDEDYGFDDDEDYPGGEDGEFGDEEDN